MADQLVDLRDDAAYAEYLRREQCARWKSLIGSRLPYRWNIRRLKPGFTLEIGCGIGRYLTYLGGHGVGVDRNAAAVGVARDRGLMAYTSDEWPASPYAVPGMFDALLAAHVLEHMSEADALGLVDSYLPYVRAGGRVILITPQERAFASDPTHVEFLDLPALTTLCGKLDLNLERACSFPFPRRLGPLFTGNEFVVAARVPQGTGSS
ncbi:MAG TPA: class I SAM-dependent methyltransferase [Acidimicrobiia bacterium]|nr:class I SAM-dependent methyltransferase [Acidimicrobiia bacterium]